MQTKKFSHGRKIKYHKNIFFWKLSIAVMPNQDKEIPSCCISSMKEIPQDGTTIILLQSDEQ